MTKEEVEAAIAVVEKSISGLEAWIIPFAWLVAIGVAGEAFIGVRQLFNNRELHRLRVEQSEIADKSRVKLEQGVADAKERTAKAELELAKFRAPRHLTGEQSRQIAEKVRAFAQTQYSMAVSFDDPEQTHIADLIWLSLRLAGWTAIDWYREGIVRAGRPRIGTGLPGMDVRVLPDPQDSTGAAAALVEALNAEGIKAELSPFQELTTFPGIKIIIGKKA